MMQSKPLAETPLYAIPDDGVPDFSAHGQPEPCGVDGTRVSGFATCLEDDQMGARLATTRLRDAPELSGLPQPVLAPEATASRFHGYFEGVETQRRLRPLARRRESTERPPFVFIRARNPWTRLRLIRLGW
jgi:hypothetical protein